MKNFNFNPEQILPVGVCWVCGKILYRKDFDKWFYFNTVLVCRDHPGVQKWYEGSLEMGEEKLRRQWDEEEKEDTNQ